ncbi:MAG: acyl-CoA dehydrogenase family protein [Hyphomonadaceae bacterium]
MTFILTEDQQMLRDTAIAFVRDELPISRLRGLRDADANGVDVEARTKLAELGFFGVLVPEAHGGSEFGMVGMGQIMEAQGRTLAPTPLLQTAIIGASVLTLGGSDAQKDAWLAKIAAGEVATALALDEGAHHNPTAIETVATADGDAYSLSGSKRFVPNGQFADMFIIVARTSGGTGDAAGLSAFLVPKDAQGLSVQPLSTLDAHGAADLALDGVKLDADSLVGKADGAFELLDQVLDRARIGLAAEMLGSATMAFEMTLEYLQTRKQFGQLIGSFQGLQHRAAIMFTELELTRSSVAAALSAVDAGRDDVAALASLAKARASETLHLVSNECVQMHGGIGMTDAHEAGFILKRARVAEAMYGGEGFHRDRYASLNGF